MTKTRDSLTIGRDVIRREIIGLEALEASLGPSFERAVKAIICLLYTSPSPRDRG